MDDSKPRDLLIIGTGGLAKEMGSLARAIDPESLRWGRIFYVTPDSRILGKKLPYGEVRYIDPDLRTLSGPVDVVLGVGSPAVKAGIMKQIEGIEKLNFPNLIHPSVHIDWEYVQLGRGNAITKGVVFTCDIRVGDFNLFNLNSTLGHDSVIGCFNVVNPGVSISGGVRIGDCCLVGTGSSILENLEVTSSVTIGAGAVVTKSIFEAGIYVGVPAKQIKGA